MSLPLTFRLDFAPIPPNLTFPPLTHRARTGLTPSTPPPAPAPESSRPGLSPTTPETIHMTTTLNKNGDNVIPTPAGTVHVRPFRSSSNAQLKAVLSFTPRMSSLDRENVKSQSDEFLGFFTLFWIGEASSFPRFPFGGNSAERQAWLCCSYAHPSSHGSRTARRSRGTLAG